MEAVLHAQLYPGDLFRCGALAVHHQFQCAGGAVGVNGSVIQQSQIKADAGFQMGQQPEAHENPLFFFFCPIKPQGHGRGMVFQHLNVADQIGHGASGHMGQRYAAAVFAQTDRAAGFSGFQNFRVSGQQFL